MRDKLDVDTATILGLYVGVGGFVIGIAGIFFTVYSFYKTPSIFWLTLSGWLAAVLLAICCVFICHRLVKLTLTATSSNESLAQQLGEAQSENSRLIMISEFIASKGMKTAASKRKKTPDDSQGEEHGSE